MEVAIRCVFTLGLGCQSAAAMQTTVFSLIATQLALELTAVLSIMADASRTVSTMAPSLRIVAAMLAITYNQTSRLAAQFVSSAFCD